MEFLIFCFENVGNLWKLMEFLIFRFENLGNLWKIIEFLIFCFENVGNLWKIMVEHASHCFSAGQRASTVEANRSLGGHVASEWQCGAAGPPSE